MSKSFTGQILHYCNVEEFQEKAARTLTELFGREKPFDVFDFSEDKKAGTYTCIGYREEEDDIPGEQKVGEPLSDEVKAAQKKANAVPVFLLNCLIRAAARNKKKPVAPAKDKAKTNGKNSKQ